MTGLDVLAKLRNSKTRPRVVVMTSDDTPETLLTAVRDQAFMYVHKPVAPATLLETVRGALQAPEPLRLRLCPHGPIGSSWWFRARARRPNASTR